jgi:hypothetical protein
MSLSKEQKTMIAGGVAGCVGYYLHSYAVLIIDK